MVVAAKGEEPGRGAHVGAGVRENTSTSQPGVIGQRNSVTCRGCLACRAVPVVVTPLLMTDAGLRDTYRDLVELDRSAAGIRFAASLPDGSPVVVQSGGRARLGEFGLFAALVAGGVAARDVAVMLSDPTVRESRSVERECPR